MSCFPFGLRPGWGPAPDGGGVGAAQRPGPEPGGGERRCVRRGGPLFSRDGGLSGRAGPPAPAGCRAVRPGNRGGLRTAGDLEGGVLLRYLRAVSMAFSMYSRLPMPWVRWSDDCRAWVLCAFPLVGGCPGSAPAGLVRAGGSADADAAAPGSGAVLLPLAYTGGIHMDGFCDTCDALASHQDRARKLEILKDSRVGGLRGAGLCVLSPPAIRPVVPAGLGEGGSVGTGSGPRALPGHVGVRGADQPGARADGLLAAFTEQEQGGAAAVLLFSVRSAGAGHRDAGGIAPLWPPPSSSISGISKWPVGSSAV